ncbi:unnamed protein product, partial [Penicillium egyptiacum]
KPRIGRLRDQETYCRSHRDLHRPRMMNLGQYGWVQMRRKRDAGVRNEMGSGPDLFVMPESDFMRPNEG